MGAESTSPWAQVKHLDDLRNKVNSQLYSSIYEDWRPKIERTVKNQTVKRVLQDNKVPGTSMGTREAEAPGLEPSGSAARFLGESQDELCKRPGACLDWSSRVKRKNFSKKKRRTKMAAKVDTLNLLGNQN